MLYCFIYLSICRDIRLHKDLAALYSLTEIEMGAILDQYLGPFKRTPIYFFNYATSHPKQRCSHHFIIAGGGNVARVKVRNDLNTALRCLTSQCSTNISQREIPNIKLE